MKVPALLGALLLTACVDAATFDAQPYPVQFSSTTNWQQVYANILKGTRGCYAGSSIIVSSSVVDGQMYPDLGYGEIVYGESAMMPITHTVTRIEKAGRGAKVMIKVGQGDSAKARDFFGKWAAHWAAGGRQCPRIGAQLPPS